MSHGTVLALHIDTHYSGRVRRERVMTGCDINSGGWGGGRMPRGCVSADSGLSKDGMC